MSLEKEDLRKKAIRALDKGVDLGFNINDYLEVREYVRESIDLKSKYIRERVVKLGLNPDSLSAYYQFDRSLIKKIYSKLKGVKILTYEEALKEYSDLVSKYNWRLVDVDLDRYTAYNYLYGEGGYVVIVDDNTHVDTPIQACLLLSRDRIFQAPHNIIIVGENSKVTIVTGCGIIKEAAAVHDGVTEIYVGRNSTVYYIMIHGWGSMQYVISRTTARIAEDSKFIYYYITFSPSRALNGLLRVYLDKRAKAHISSIIASRRKSVIEMNKEAYAYGNGTSIKMISRLLAGHGSRMKSKLAIYAEAPYIKGHTECNGLLLTEDSDIETIPILKARYRDVELTHEASIGKLAEDEIIYLMSKGFSREEAEAVLIRGFMSIKIEGINPSVEKMIKHAIALASKGL